MIILRYIDDITHITFNNCERSTGVLTFYKAHIGSMFSALGTVSPGIRFMVNKINSVFFLRLLWFLSMIHSELLGYLTVRFKTGST
jgi:hypothetical protein